MFFKTLYYRILGWTSEVTVPERTKCIICVAPHTSNLDFFMGEIFYHAIGRKAGFLMKKEWFFWPLGPLFRALGGIPVVRDSKTHMTDNLAETARRSETFSLAVTPEGTRSLQPHWKRGFYFIALKAGIPIQLYAIDYKHRHITCTKEIHPTGDVDKDMAEIFAYYAKFADGAKYPEKFMIEDIAESGVQRG